MTTQISAAIGTEYGNLNTYASNTNTAANYVYAASNGASGGSAQYTTQSTEITGAVTQFTTLYDLLNNDIIEPDYLTKYKGIQKFVTYGVGLTAIGKFFFVNKQFS